MAGSRAASLHGFAADGAILRYLCPAGMGMCPGGFTGIAPVTEGRTDCNDSRMTVTFPISCWGDSDDDGFAPLGAPESRLCEETCPLFRTGIPPQSLADCNDMDGSVITTRPFWLDCYDDGYAVRGAAMP